MHIFILLLSTYLSLHIAWLPLFMWQHMALPAWGAALAYFLVVGWFTFLVSAVFFCMRALLPQRWRRGGLLCALPLFFYLLANHSLPFCKGVRGYPLANPLLPAVRLLTPQQTLPRGQWAQVTLGDRTAWVYPLLPAAHYGGRSRKARAQQTYQQISEIAAPPGGEGVVVSPESFFPYEVTEQEAARWRSVLPRGVEWVFGTMQGAEASPFSHQIILKICHNSSKTHSTPIKLPYVKQLCIDLFEEYDDKVILHRLAKLFSGKNRMGDFGGVIAGNGFSARVGFSQGIESSQGAGCLQKEMSFRPEGGLLAKEGWRPLICAESLWPPTRRLGASIVFANETWFPGWVQWLLQASAAWRALVDRESVLWVGHHDCVLY